MFIYRDHISESLGIRNIFEIYPELSPEELYASPEDAELSTWCTGFQWTGPMMDYHKNTWKGDDRTEAQKEATKKWKQDYKSFIKIPTKKGGKLSEAHKQALRVPRPGAGKHGNQAKGDYHFAKQILTCPHCGKQGGGGAIKRWHFDNCKHK